jgi:hypothetical protein
MSRKWLVAAVLALAAVAVPAYAAGSDGGAAQSGFSPKTLKGNWSGTWRNLTFGTSGTITGSFTTPNRGRRLRITLDFGGSVFGCQDPPPGTITLARGRRANQWHRGGFTLRGPSIALGQRTIRYAHSTRRVTGRGQDPPCAQGLTWTLAGRISRNLRRLTATVDITLPGGSKAESRLDVRKR